MPSTAGQRAARDQSGFHSLAQSNHRVSLAMLQAWLWLWLRLR